jgi:hypothetical protein
MIVHNGQTANPLNKYNKMSKEISGKRNKTDADHEELAKIAFMSSLYMGQDKNGNTVPVLPGANFEAMLIAASKKSKEGNLAKAGMFVDGNPVLIYEGSKDPEEMYKDERFVDTRAVAIQRARIMRTRALFSEWEADVTINYDDGVINESRIDLWLRTAGNAIGLCEMRPRFGRFDVV